MAAKPSTPYTSSLPRPSHSESSTNAPISTARVMLGAGPTSHKKPASAEISSGYRAQVHLSGNRRASSQVSAPIRSATFCPLSAIRCASPARAKASRTLRPSLKVACERSLRSPSSTARSKADWRGVRWTLRPRRNQPRTPRSGSRWRTSAATSTSRMPCTRSQKA